MRHAPWTVGRITRANLRASCLTRSEEEERCMKTNENAQSCIGVVVQ